MNDFIPGLDLILLNILFLIIAFAGGFKLALAGMRQEAIEANVAQWTVDPQTGKIKFEWKGGESK